MKEIINQLNFIKIKNFSCTKDTAHRMKTQAADWEKMFPKDIYSSYPKCAKNTQQIYTQKLSKIDKRLEQTPHQRSYVDSKEAHERMFNIDIMREIQFQTTMRYHYTPIRIAKMTRTICW